MLVAASYRVGLSGTRCDYHPACRNKPYRGLVIFATGFMGRMSIRVDYCRRHWRHVVDGEGL